MNGEISVDDYLIRRAAKTDAVQVGQHIDRILQTPSTKMCTANMEIESKTLEQHLEYADAYWNILLANNTVKAVTSCLRWRGDSAWLFCSVESPYLYGEGFRHSGGSLSEYLTAEAIAWAKMQSWATKIVGCIQDNNSSSRRLLAHFGFQLDGSCPADDCPRRDDRVYQFWILPCAGRFGKGVSSRSK